MSPHPSRVGKHPPARCRKSSRPRHLGWRRFRHCLTPGRCRTGMAIARTMTRITLNEQIILRSRHTLHRQSISLCCAVSRTGGDTIDIDNTLSSNIHSENDTLSSSLSGKVILPLNQPYSHLAPQCVPGGIGVKSALSCLFRRQLIQCRKTLKIHRTQRTVKMPGDLRCASFPTGAAIPKSMPC